LLYWQVGQVLVPTILTRSAAGDYGELTLPMPLSDVLGDDSAWVWLDGRGVGRYIAVDVRVDDQTSEFTVLQSNPFNTVCADDVWPPIVAQDVLFRHMRALLVDAGVLAAWCENMGQAEIWLRDYYLGNHRLPWILF
jgi:hypothetical protein